MYPLSILPVFSVLNKHFDTGVRTVEKGNCRTRRLYVVVFCILVKERVHSYRYSTSWILCLYRQHWATTIRSRCASTPFSLSVYWTATHVVWGSLSTRTLKETVHPLRKDVTNLLIFVQQFVDVRYKHHAIPTIVNHNPPLILYSILFPITCKHVIPKTITISVKHACFCFNKMNIRVWILHVGRVKLLTFKIKR